jgi:hypothetical protein
MESAPADQAGGGKDRLDGLQGWPAPINTNLQKESLMHPVPESD